MKISAIILAAGESRRMGYPKPLADFQGHSFLQTVIRNFNQSGISDVVVVLGYRAKEIRRELQLSPAVVVVNEHYRLGQFSSFQRGIKDLDPKTTGTFLALVDQPQIPVAVMTTVISAFEKNPDKIVIPVVKGRRGHPPIFPKVLFREILAATDKTAKDIIDNHAAEVMEVEVADERILWNLNTPEDLKRAEEAINSKEELQLG